MVRRIVAGVLLILVVTVGLAVAGAAAGPTSIGAAADAYVNE